MGYPPIQEHAKTTTLLLALLLGGCFPSTSLSKLNVDDTRQHDVSILIPDTSGCGTLHVTSSFITFTSQSPTPGGQNHMVTLYIAPNRTSQAATFVMGHCRYIARTSAARGTVAMQGIPPGEYFLVLNDVPSSTVQAELTLGILNKSGKLHVRWLEVIDNSVVVAMTIEAS